MRMSSLESGATVSMILAMSAATFLSVSHPGLHFLAFAVAWASLLVLTLGSIPPRWAPALLFLVPVFLAGSIWAPETRSGTDTWFEADHWRYVPAARDGSISPRHLGLPVFLDISRGFPDTQVAETVLCTGSAVAAALATGASISAAASSRVGFVGISLLIAGSFTLGRWALSGVVESTMYSLALFAAAIRMFLSRDSMAQAPPWAAGLLFAAALGVSLDNVFLGLPLAAVLLRRPGETPGRRVRNAAVFAGAAGAGYAVLGVAGVLGGRVVSELQDAALGDGGTYSQFVLLYLRPEHLFHPVEIAATAFRVFVMSVVAQPGVAPRTYAYDPRAWMLFTPGTILVIALLAVIVWAAWPGFRALRTSPNPLGGVAVFALAAFVGVRFLWHVVFAPREVTLFSAQIHLACSFLLALAAGATAAPRRTVIAVVATLLVLVLLGLNGAYFLALP